MKDDAVRGLVQKLTNLDAPTIAVLAANQNFATNIQQKVVYPYRALDREVSSMISYLAAFKELSAQLETLPTKMQEHEASVRGGGGHKPTSTRIQNTQRYSRKKEH